MAKSEAKWQVVFNQYLREKRLHGFYELKQTSATSFPISKLELHQYEGLQATENEGLVWKLSDEDRRKKPCDTLCIPPLPSFVVIKFPDAFYFIRIKDVVELVDKKATSITQLHAAKVAQRIVRVKD
jgi:penicillin-binding protein-related factor A (putative recombinase)